MFLTDGDPTARGNGSGADSGFPNGSYLTMNPAFTQSNNLKASGLHMFAIGVGAALTNEDSKVRVRAISGPKAFPENPLLGADYTVISDFRQLEEALATIGRALCSVRVRVTKLVDERGRRHVRARERVEVRRHRDGLGDSGQLPLAGAGRRARPAVGRKHADGDDRG